MPKNVGTLPPLPMTLWWPAWHSGFQTLLTPPRITICTPGVAETSFRKRTPAFSARCYLHSQRIICYSDTLSSSILSLQGWSPLTPVISHPKTGSNAAQSWTTMPYRFPHACKMTAKQSSRSFPVGPVVKIPCF